MDYISHFAPIQHNAILPISVFSNVDVLIPFFMPKQGEYLLFPVYFNSLQEQAEQLVMDGKGYSEKSNEDWDYEEVIEVKEVA